MIQRALLLVLDGWGINPRREGNAIELAETPYWHSLLDRWPHTALLASGEAVGLRAGLMGNSEVGHMTLGAGRVIRQDITRIDRAIDEGKLGGILPSEGRLHLYGLVSDGGVHSAEEHYFALVDLADRKGLSVRFHVLTDGRDTPPDSGLLWVGRLAERLARCRDARVATLMGRYWGMDRDKRWERTSLGYHAVVMGEGREAADPLEAVRDAYRRGETDEFIRPYVFTEGRPQDGETVLCFNFRADRMRQMAAALAFDDFEGFERRSRPRVSVTTMTRYREDWTLPAAFPPEEHRAILGEVLAERGVTQLRIAETEKYAHVTFFFNAGSDEPLPREERILVPSPKVATYDLQPEMSAKGVTDKAVEAVRSDRFGAIVQNYANPDMVGHTGDLAATVRACAFIDRCLRRVVSAACDRGWRVLITGDHGNCEQMVDYDTGKIHTYHTTNPVPLVLVGGDAEGVRLRDGGSFQDVAPTMLDLMGIPKPPEMTGASLLAF